ncbi:MAG: tRNA (N6-isopentenyl adenosine(37)-C2)-methylthiotransferase MiaB [Clostridia bacterium]|nr:tRNA (N6-isopentenyl adenosine(37)-C2)-methylthiotransferase MiaB [Clostridia bacterium]
MTEQKHERAEIFVPPEEIKRQLAVADGVAARFAAEGRIGDKKPLCFVQTFGCQQNEADSERMAGYAVRMGYGLTDQPDKADLILVNTCAIREHAEKKVFSIVGQYRHIKDVNPALVIGIGGCMVTQEHRADKFKMSYPYVSFTFDTGSIHRLPELVSAALSGGKRQFLHSGEYRIAEDIPVARVAQHKGWLPIMYGCNNFCSYCIVPYVRGRERSREPGDILEDAKRLIDSGAREITLLGQNVNSYGNDAGFGVDIAELMHRICRLDGDFRVRFMTSHPKDASDGLIVAMAEEEKIVKHFHLPVQSGSDEILRRMNRKYTAEKYLERIEKLKKTVPDVSITSDMIVGFPGETDADFEDTMTMLRTVRYDAVFSFIYSPRTGTPAASMPDQVPHEVSTTRMERLLALQGDISAERSGRFVGRKLRLLADEVSRTDGSMLTGRGEPVRPVHFKAPADLVGQFVTVEITEADAYAMYGKLI